MPSKKKAGGGQNKKKAAAAKAKQAAAERKANRIVEDKTFGLKNKNKSKKVQKYIANVTKTAKGEKATKEYQLKLQAAARAKKQQAYEAAKALGGLFNKKEKKKKKKKKKDGASSSGPGSGVATADGKVNLYVDRRDTKEQDTSANWDEETLRKAVAQKHGKELNNNNPTTIVCKHFLDAIEKGLYGWFWKCPGGGDKCKYKHCLPPGFVFKTKAQQLAERKAAEEANSVDICELIEEQRRALPPGGERVTEKTFFEWKARKRARLEKERAERIKEEKKKKGGARNMLAGMGLSGRDLFQYDPTLFRDDDNAASSSSSSSSSSTSANAGKTAEELKEEEEIRKTMGVVKEWGSGKAKGGSSTSTKEKEKGESSSLLQTIAEKT
eukprot:g407.t1